MATKTDVTNFAADPDEKTLEQFEHCYSQDYVEKAALMPDAHVGYVAPIGAVLATKNKVVPAWVGYDIGCGMTAARLTGVKDSDVEEHIEEIYTSVKRSVPMGLGRIHKTTERMSKETKQAFETLLKKFKEGVYDPKILDFIKSVAIRHLGTLGHGNHFIELGIDSKNNVWIVVHSGSRGIGHEVAKRYMKKTAQKETGYEATHPLDVTSQVGKEYMNVLEFGLAFALLNRKEMIFQVIDCVSHILGREVTYEIWANKNHNHAVYEEGLLVHRKGATPAGKGERGVIPANMRDGCFLVEGKGNKKFLQSSSHGAGRLFGRAAAKQQFDMKEFEETMKGIRGTISEGTLDEAPMAYKDISTVMNAQKESVKVVEHLKPLINWKGEARRKRK